MYKSSLINVQSIAGHELRIFISILDPKNCDLPYFVLAVLITQNSISFMYTNNADVSTHGGRQTLKSASFLRRNSIDFKTYST